MDNFLKGLLILQHLEIDVCAEVVDNNIYVAAISADHPLLKQLNALGFYREGSGDLVYHT